ncbi:sensor histidine kinase [Conexibacter sp. SYSU D00693]|uniref:sensor histidine kinase n=1 Tax=Conexibacter sp. SYSU D00693 TaxID=2812560 RepID=UPI00196AFA55|nr:sensor histidine kinase [Conexibacter sp. SYSU D00693]
MPSSTPSARSPLAGEDLLPALATATADVVGEAFLSTLATVLGPAVGAEEVVLAEEDVPGRCRVRTAWRADGRPPARGDDATPADDALVLQLRDGGKTPVGHLAVRGATLDDDGRKALDVLAARAAAELGRLRQARALRARESEVARARTRVLQAGDEERRRIGRNLHDGPQQRLVALGHLIDLGLRKAGEAVDPQAATLLQRAREEAAETLDELRELARGLHPAGLAERGVVPALEALARRSPVPVELGALPGRRLPDPVEVTAYYLVSEAITNAARHAGATKVRVDVADRGPHVEVRISDDGAGGADLEGGTGIQGLRDRVAVLAGTLEVTSPPGEGTTLHATIPLAQWRTAAEPFLEFGSADDGGHGQRSIAEILAGRRTVSVGLAREWDLEGGPPRIGTRLPIRDHRGIDHGAVVVQRVGLVTYGELDGVLTPEELGHPDVDAWLVRQRNFYDGCRDELAVLLGEPGWRLTDGEPMVVVWFTPE